MNQLKVYNNLVSISELSESASIFCQSEKHLFYYLLELSNEEFQFY